MTKRRARLWVVCRHCERWNLTPLETRWEAIEEAERAFRATRLRISTDNIGLARLTEGLELVRIGAPPRLELATWRYGDQFGRRRRKAFAVTGLGMAASALVMVPSLGLGVGVTTVGVAAYLTHTIMDHRKFQKDRNVATIFLTDDEGEVLPLTKWDTWTTTLVPITDSQTWQLKVHHRALEPTVRRARLFWRKQAREQSAKPAILTGAAAQSALAALVPYANPTGGTARRIREAVGVIESSSSVDQLVYSAAEHSSPVHRLPARLRLALEMVLHEDDERRAMEGELTALEQRWREAEDIAAIADSLLIPANTVARVEALRRRD